MPPVAKKSGRLVVVALALAGLLSALVSWLVIGRSGPRDDAAIPATGMVATALRALPADSYVVATVPDLPGYARSFHATAFGRMLADPEIRAASKKLFAAPGGSDATSALGGVLESLGELGRLGPRSLAIAVFPLPRGLSARSGFGAVVACEDPGKMLAWFDERVAAANEGQAAAPEGDVEPLSGSTNGTPFVCRAELCRATRGNTFYLASPRAALDRLLTELPEHGRTLADQPRLRQAIEQSRAGTTGFFAFADLGRLAADAGRALAGDAAAGRLIALLGLDALDTLAFSESTDGEMFHDRLLLRYDHTRTPLLTALLVPPAHELVLDSALGADATTAWFAALPDLAQTWDRGVAALRAGTPPEQQAGIDAAIAAIDGQLGFALRDDLLAAFGGELGFAWSPEPTAAAATAAAAPGTLPGAGLLARSLLGVRALLLCGVRDPLRAEKLILGIEQSLRARDVPVTVAALGQGKLWTITLGDEPGRHPAIALFDDRMVFATRADDLRRLIAESSKPLAGDPVYQTLRARLGGPASLVAWSRTSGTSFKDLLLSVAAAVPEPSAEPAQPQPQEQVQEPVPSPAPAPSPVPAPLAEFGARIDRHLASMPPSLAVGRGQPGQLEYEALTPFNVGIAASLVLALATPQIEAAAAGREIERSLTALRSIAFACESYALERGAPPSAASIAEAQALLAPTWASELPIADAWGYGLDFKSNGSVYVVASAGSDGRFERDWTAECLAGCEALAGVTTTSGEDLVIAGGQIIRAPAAAVAP